MKCEKSTGSARAGGKCTRPARSAKRLAGNTKRQQEAQGPEGSTKSQWEARGAGTPAGKESGAPFCHIAPALPRSLARPIPSARRISPARCIPPSGAFPPGASLCGLFWYPRFCSPAVRPVCRKRGILPPSAQGASVPAAVAAVFEKSSADFITVSPCYVRWIVL